MEFKFLGDGMKKAKISKKAVRRESCRVAAAFGVKFFGPLALNPDKRKIDHHFKGQVSQQVEIVWILDLPSAQWTNLFIFTGEGKGYSSICRTKRELTHVQPQHYEIMARALYRLGVEDEAELTKLEWPLSAHEKSELRLSLPREFWPQKWLDEEAAQ
ncbi:MAG: hypothetical protein EOP04_25050 [Proteobacteria bacterium]|nr:MAG: hypothetical protein EOP04_25050 [Pseudomonadota bacterium]